MKTLLVKVDYTDSTNKFWFESYIKNQKVTFDPEKESIHECISRICKDEGMILTYKAKPQGNIFRDNKEGEAKIVGYIYRGKSEIYDRNMSKPQTGLFDVWVTIHEIIDFEFEEIDQ